MGEMISAAAADAPAGDGGDTFVTFVVDKQRFGVPVLRVQDILSPEHIALVPLAPASICGLINLRGRIVTVIDVRTRLGLPAYDGERAMGVTVEHRGDLFTLLVDRVGDVAELPRDRLEEKPSTLHSSWREVAAGVWRLDEGLMIVLDVDRLLELN
jgi:purine-binding chemotaxis protein CheW